MNSLLQKKITYHSLLIFALPTIISNIFMSIYGTVDGIFVSNLLGTTALSAVNIVSPLLMIVLAIGIMFGTGGSAYISAKLGEGKQEEARQVFTLLVIVCFAISVALSAIGFLFRKPIFSLLGADESLYVLCEAYAVPLFVIIPFALVGMLFQMSFIAAGKPSLGMLFSIIGGVMNIVLDYVLIAKLNLGIAGAAIATGLGYAFPAFVGLIYFSMVRSGSLYFVRPVFDRKALLKSASNGSSELVGMLSSSLTMIVMNNILMRISGSDGVSAITVMMYAQSILSATFMGYTQGIAPVISFNYGMKNTDNLKKIHRITLILILIISVGTFLLSFILARPAASIFASNNQNVLNLAVDGLSKFSIAFLFMGFNIYSSAMFTALNDGRTSAILSFCRTCLFLLVALITLPELLGILGVWIALPAAEVISIILTIYYFKKYNKKYGFA